MYIQLIILFVLIIYNNSILAQIGDSCEIPTTGNLGICKLSTNCPSAQEQAKNGISPKICGFYQLTIPIVCCDNLFISNSNGGDVLVNDNTFFSHSIRSTTTTTTRPKTSSESSFFYPSDLTFGSSLPSSSSSSLLSSFSASSGISEQKCEEYNKQAVKVIQAIPLVPNTEAISLNVVKCDYNGVALIVGGEPALAGEFPFMALIGFNIDNKIEWRCGGTLISDEYILTAAHCTYSRDADAPEVVRLGELDILTTNDGSTYKDYNIKNIIVHPKYHYPQKYHDIALIQVDRKINFNEYIRPACLYTKSTIEQSEAIATGWGKTDYAAAEPSNKLMKVALNVYRNSQCAKNYQISKQLPQGIISSMLCAGELSGGKDTCQGDSGGPLLITKKGNQCKFFIIGVTSFGKSCAQRNVAAIYTRVSEYVSWIEKNVW